MTLTDELKILDGKIKTNQVWFDLDRKAAKISALLSKELDKYEYLTGVDLEYKPWVTKRVKFEYSLLDQPLKTRLMKDDKVDKVVKDNNDLVYDSVHNFDKYSVSSFNEITSVDSKFDTLNIFLKNVNN